MEIPILEDVKVQSHTDIPAFKVIAFMSEADLSECIALGDYQRELSEASITETALPVISPF